jgi:hypothetical protein
MSALLTYFQVGGAAAQQAGHFPLAIGARRTRNSLREFMPKLSAGSLTLCASGLAQPLPRHPPAIRASEPPPRIAGGLPADTAEVPDRTRACAHLAARLPRPRFRLHRSRPRRGQNRQRQSLYEAQAALVELSPIVNLPCQVAARPCSQNCKARQRSPPPGAPVAERTNASWFLWAHAVSTQKETYFVRIM